MQNCMPIVCHMTQYCAQVLSFITEQQHKVMCQENQTHLKFVPHILANLVQDSAFINHAMTRQIIAGFAITYLTGKNPTQLQGDK